MVRFTKYMYILSMRVDEVIARMAKKDMAHAVAEFKKLRCRDLKKRMPPQGSHGALSSD